jgi:exonuclease SbcC
MLKLILKNFRKFTSAEFTFDQQLSLIAGRSGSGKTTIFMGIMFALTGEGKKLPTYGKTSCSVTLILHNESNEEVTIVRTKRPNRLKVTTNNCTYEDKEGQALIDEMFSQYHMGYMSQRTDNKSFILMTPVDKMRYIEKMAFGGENVDQLIANCKEMVKTRKNEMMLTNRQRETTEQMLKDMKITKTTSSEELLEEEEYNLQITKNESDISNLQDVLSKTQNLIKFQKEVKKQLDSIPSVSEDIDELENELQRISTHKQNWERYQKEKQKLKKLNEPSGMSKEEIKEIIQDMKSIIELEREVSNESSIKKKVTKLTTQIEDSMVHMICPGCETEVAMWCNKLIIPEKKGITQNEVKLLTTEEAKRLEEKRMKATIQLEDIEKKNGELIELKAEYPSLKNAQRQLDNLFKMRVADDTYARQKMLCSSLKVEKPDYNEQTEIELRQKKKHIYQRKEKENTLQGINIEHKPNNLQSQIHDLDSSIKTLYNKKYAAKSIKYWNKVEELTKIEEELNKSYPRAVKLHEIIKTAEKMAVTEVIEEINLHAQMYLDSFLENINVMLVFDGVKLNVDVLQDGNDSDIQNLSGGELARVILAFTIALAEVNNVKILLLDECVASLDQESTGQVIDTIKDNFKGTVICIAHQTTTGVFDYVLTL